MASCRWAPHLAEARTRINEDLAALPEEEQVSRGQELMSLLGAQDLSSVPSAVVKRSVDCASMGDWNVKVKHTFIEVSIPPCREGRRRTVSEPTLSEFEKPDMPWKSSSHSKLQDVSDASTDDSLEGDGSCTREDSIREDVCCSSESETDREMPVQPALPYQYVVGPWLMPVGYAANGSAMCFAPSNGFVQWMDPSMATVKCNGLDTNEAEPTEWRTTVMIRNMPNNYTREMLLELVDSMGLAGVYDFAYLPIDFQSQAGLGYSFINFVTVADAQLCFDRLEGFSNWKVPSEKTCTVSWSAPTQGLEEHIDRYRNSPVMHASLPDDWKPVLFRQGVRRAFPPPTRPIKTPKVRQPPGKTTSA